MPTTTALPAHLVRRNAVRDLRDHLLALYGVRPDFNGSIVEQLPDDKRRGEIAEAMFALNRLAGLEEDLAPCTCSAPENVGFFCACCRVENTVGHACGGGSRWL